MGRRHVALIALGIALWLAAFAAWRIAPGVDVRLLGMIAARRSSGVAEAAKALTQFGSYQVLVGATALAAIWLVVARREARAAAWLFAATLAGRALTGIEKEAFARERPPLSGRLVDEFSASFPSAHAFNTMLVGLVVVIALRGDRRAFAAAVAFSLAVGTTRLILAVHWPSDVIAGWGSALAWTLLWRPLLHLRTEPLTAGRDS